MTFSFPLKGDAPLEGSQFNTTQWSMVLLAGQPQIAHAEAALENLCRTYWKPLYAYVRRQGHGPQDAQDLTQAFFARLLEMQYLSLASKERGRFRSFLLTSLKHFLINDWVRSQAQKRGGGHTVIPLDEASAEQCCSQHTSQTLAADSVYDQKWALTLLESAMDRLREEYAAAEKGTLFDQLKPMLLAGGSAETYRTLASSLGMSEGAVKVALHRLRKRFGDMVRLEVARTVASPADIDDELRCLHAALSQ
jgi:RNA polymerase sigma factor (sigma-70 family)